MTDIFGQSEYSLSLVRIFCQPLTFSGDFFKLTVWRPFLLFLIYSNRARLLHVDTLRETDGAYLRYYIQTTGRPPK